MHNDPRIIRLACTECDRQDKDAITEADLTQCEGEGWADISREQSFEQSHQTFAPGEEPNGFTVLGWYTHIGTCPECTHEG